MLAHYVSLICCGQSISLGIESIQTVRYTVSGCGLGLGRSLITRRHMKLDY